MVIPSELKLRHIRVFLAVARAGSVSGAARGLHVSQPAVSKTLADTERLVGQALFERSGRRMVLTAAGRMLRRHAIEAMRALERGIEEINGARPAGRLAVGVLPTVAGSLFPSVVQQFSRARASCISVTTGPHGYLLERLRRGDIELMVGRMPEPDEMAGLGFEFLYEDPVELVARPQHPGLGGAPAQALRSNPVILPTRASIIRRLVDRYLGAQGCDRVQPVLETVSPNLALPLVEASDMLWFISRSVVARALASGRVARFDLGARYMSGAVGITRKNPDEPDADVAFLIELLRKFAAV